MRRAVRDTLENHDDLIQQYYRLAYGGASPLVVSLRSLTSALRAPLTPRRRLAERKRLQVAYKVRKTRKKREKSTVQSERTSCNQHQQHNI